jgi:hypothetical protein
MITPINLFLISIIILMILNIAISIIMIYKIDTIVYALSNIIIIKENKG